MRNKNDLFTIWQAVDWLECKTWDKVDDCWIPADNDTTSMIYASKVIGDYGNSSFSIVLDYGLSLLNILTDSEDVTKSLVERIDS